MALQQECSAGPAGAPGAMSVHISWIKGLNTQLPPCLCVRTHFLVLPLSREMVTQRGDCRLAVSPAGVMLHLPVMFLFLSSTLPFLEMMN